MLEVLARYHNEWKAICVSFGVPKDVADDLVQDMYLKVHSAIDNVDRIMYNDTEPNKYYVYITLRNLCFDWIKNNKKYKVFSIDEVEMNLESVEVNWDKFYALEKVLDNIDYEVDNFNHWYDRSLFEVYYKGSVSMRELSKYTGISLTSIFNSCKRYKRYLKNKLGEDYEDFLNGDYDKIK